MMSVFKDVEYRPSLLQLEQHDEIVAMGYALGGVCLKSHARGDWMVCGASEAGGMERDGRRAPL